MEDLRPMIDEARFWRNAVGDCKKAVNVCNKILKVAPDNRDALLIKAGALQEQGEAEVSFQLIGKIIETWPSHWEAYYLLALSTFGMNEEAGLKLMRKSLELEENFDNTICHAQMLYLAGKDSYVEFVEKARKMNSIRLDNFMKNGWTWDIDSVKPTRNEAKQAEKFIKGFNRMAKTKKEKR